MELQLTTSAPVLVHPALTGDQAELVHQALIAFLNSPAGHLASDPEEEAQIKKQVSELVFFFDAVVAHPENFPLRSVEDTKRLVRAHKAARKGPSQSKSLRNKRKARQVARMSHAKRRRIQRKEQAAKHNETLAEVAKQQEAAQREAASAQQRMIDRFEYLAAKDTLSNEEVQEVIELFGSNEGAARMREIRAGSSFENRIMAAVERRDELPEHP